MSVALYALLGRHSKGKTNIIVSDLKLDQIIFAGKKQNPGRTTRRKFMKIQKNDPTSGWLKHHSIILCIDS